MTRFVLLTDEPEKARRSITDATSWTERTFQNAAEALHWERTMRSTGAVALESRGFKHGIAFDLAPKSERWAIGG